MTLRVVTGTDPSLLFENPVRVWAPFDMDGALQALREAEAALDAGYWIAGALTYELGCAFNGIRTHAPALPLLVLGAFPPPHRRGWHGRRADASMSAPLPRIPFDGYAANIDRLLERIRDGEVYQVNYTVPFDARAHGDPFALYLRLARRSRAGYSVYLEHGDLALASISPELFLRFDGDRVRTKPMKGTATPDAASELCDEKNRAEHLMIVDLLRNDLHRVCDEVRVERLFEIERYPTFATMTSTIAGDLRPRWMLADVLRATFPCGSVTGAPKKAAMQHIAGIEPHPRGFYTGSIGFLSPRRRGWWNVAIRTLQFQASALRFDAGGGIVFDSTAENEWNEIGIKSRFLAPAYAQFALLETLRRDGDTQAHLRRLERSARAFGMRFDGAALHDRIRSARADSGDLVRIELSANGAGVSVRDAGSPQEPVALCLSSRTVDSRDPFLLHKTTWRPAHDAALREASERGCFDAILRNERGEITEGARTNIFLEIGNTLYTPPLACGVLPGILRSKLVSEGKAAERILFPEDLLTATAIFAGNSARGLLRARLQ